MRLDQAEGVKVDEASPCCCCCDWCLTCRRRLHHLLTLQAVASSWRWWPVPAPGRVVGLLVRVLVRARQEVRLAPSIVCTGARWCCCREPPLQCVQALRLVVLSQLGVLAQWEGRPQLGVLVVLVEAEGQIAR
jgi:hypothetical protein